MITSVRRAVIVFAVLVGGAAGAGGIVLAAQAPGVQDVERPSPYVGQIDPTGFFRYRDSSVVRLWQDYLLKPGDRVDQVVVISGTATIEGTVDGDVVVVMGTTKVAATAVIRGSLVVVAGDAVVTDGAVVRGDLVLVGGTLETPLGFRSGGEHIVIGAPWMGDKLRQVAPWLTRGLLWGRVIVPDLLWIWMIAGVFFLIGLVLNLVLHEPVGACAKLLSEKPFSTFLSGLLVMLLAAPITVLLAATVVGIVIIPFFWCALVIAGLVGRVGVARWIGRSMTGMRETETRAQGIRSFVLGVLVLYFLYLLPVIGIVTWAMVGVFGIGSAYRTFMAGLRRERPAKPVTPPVVPPPPAPFNPPAMPITPPAPVPPPAPIAMAAPVVTPAPSELPSQAAPVVTAPPPPPGSLLGMPRATFVDRFAAFALDLTLVLVIYAAFVGNSHSRWDDDNSGGAFFALLLIYFVAFWAWKGTTIGGIICNLRVIRSDGKSLTFPDAFVRGLTSILSFAALGLGVLWILKEPNPDKQTWHDIVAGTYVVRVPAGSALLT